MLGAPSTDGRRAMVMQVANAFMLELSERVFLALGVDTSEIKSIVRDAKSLVPELDSYKEANGTDEGHEDPKEASTVPTGGT